MEYIYHENKILKEENDILRMQVLSPGNLDKLESVVASLISMQRDRINNLEKGKSTTPLHP